MTNANEKPTERNAAYHLSENIAHLLKSHHTNESELARNLNVTYNTIHRLVSGTTSDPKLSTLQQIADYFNVGLDYLLSSPCTQPTSASDQPKFVPIVSWENIQSVDFFYTFNVGNWTQWIPVATNEKKLMNDRCYALESTRSMQPKFPIGTTFIVKPDEPPIDGDFVIVRFKDDNSVSLRELIVDSPDWQLQSVIPGSKNLTMHRNKIDIIGVVILTLIQTRNR